MAAWTDAGIGRCEEDACVGNSSGVQSQMIGVGGDQDPSLKFPAPDL
jgi:hypothetical protein